MLHIGCHLSIAKGWARMAEEALGIAADTFQFFSRNPRGSKQKAPNEADLEALAALLRDTYGSDIKVFGAEIPHSVRAKESSAEGRSIFAHDPGGKVAEAYGNLTREVLRLEKQRAKSRAGLSL